MTHEKGSSEHGAVLVVDDDDGVRDALADALTDEGYRVVMASDGQQALDLLAGGEPLCLMLLDLTMPRVNGWEVLEELSVNPALPKVPVVVLTGASSSQLQTVSAPVVLQKPVNFDALLAALQAHC